MEPRRFLFVMWEGGGNVPPQLGLAGKLVARGQQVRVLTEPSLRRDVDATGAAYRSFTVTSTPGPRSAPWPPPATVSCSGPRGPTPPTP
jgi:UDP:flavonoid glycosyltransferase YjiC (YdhE family)